MLNKFFAPSDRIYLTSGAHDIYDETRHRIDASTDRLFAVLLVFQWVLGLVFAFGFSPATWAGATSQIHFHVYLALFLGGALAFYPAYMNWREPGRARNRYITAVAQMGFSALFVHLTGGRIETHFHIFGSLAFLAFYRREKVLYVASIVTALDHFVMGHISPLSLYGTLTSTPWRAVEHTLWVGFEDLFLVLSIRWSLVEMKSMAQTQFDLKKTLGSVEKLAADRAAELVLSKETILEQQRTMTSTEGRNEVVGLVLIHSVAERALAYRNSMIRACAVKVKMDLPPQRLFVNCRANELIQACVHLLDHAIDTKSAIGERHLLLKVRPQGSSIELVIEGTGGAWRNQHDVDYSIADNCVRSHEGTMKFEETDGRLRFTLNLPNALAIESSQRAI